MCKSDIEDEFHLLTMCHVYSDLRDTLYFKAFIVNQDFDQHDDLEKFVYINDNMQTALAKFLFAAMRRRRNSLYNIH